MTIVSSEGSTVVHERRLLQTNVIQPKASGASELTAAIANIQQNPVNSHIPAINFNVNVPQTISQIYCVRADQDWAFLDMHLTIQTALTDVAMMRTTVSTLIETNTGSICLRCANAYGVFLNIERIGSFENARRQLKQAGPQRDYSAKFSFLLTYEVSTKTNNYV